MWAVLSFAGAIALSCLMATASISRVVVPVLGIFLLGWAAIAVWYLWQGETIWVHAVEGAPPKRQQKRRITGWLWGLTHPSAKH